MYVIKRSLLVCYGNGGILRIQGRIEQNQLWLYNETPSAHSHPNHLTREKEKRRKGEKEKGFLTLTCTTASKMGIRDWGTQT